MYLKKLELSGFKSFARSTVLEFPSKVTAIVGPNGSGKSNIKEGIQWVLGEQSMKSLRGKKGEDLIWNGSQQIPRVGKASVTLLFDNKDGKIPIEFDEVAISRKIFRDGLNEYYINDSQVRLKDVVELMARIGLGETKHNIIGQGEVDRILLSSPRERREMLEEALGLRVYQLKKNEAERKLEATGSNMKQVEALVREIAPHLKFLSAQAKKAEARGTVEGELKQFQKIYFAKESKEIQDEKKSVEGRAAPVLKKREEAKKEMEHLRREVAEAEKSLAGVSVKSEDEKKLMELEARRRELEREIGRLEGKLEVEQEKAKSPRLRAVDTRYIQDEIREFLSEIRAIIEEEDHMEAVRSHLLVLIEDMEGLLNQIERGTVEEKRDEKEFVILRELEKTLAPLQGELTRTTKEIDKLQSVRRAEVEKYRNVQQSIRELDQQLRAYQDEERDLALALERFKFDEERLRLRREVFIRELEESEIKREELSPAMLDGYEAMSGEELKRKIERLRGKLEEIGGIDPAVVKEYQETESRHSFLTKELEDLEQASGSLKELIKELDQHIKKDFKEGFVKIKDEFHNYFRIIFGGGKASLHFVDVPIRAQHEEGEGEEMEEEHGPIEEGIDISVDLPRKRIKGLAMLSGGERALTSVALLFAITAVNPPPFLVLDETDAALDEANSQRYAAILKELAKKTQLLLVTHNRETMKVAGILYGVTMGDDGVSKLLSLKLEEAEVYTNR
ncbi:MAG: AAA family ATPase [Candidatus Sungiibacteriota bacterium]|uniref:AAA family ATPase n=1 Tax=Candidatus Sungiibacteriota bacterium TaxID=2750080 RepID=A0A7T5RJ18_9BACT|nr:MAG: AAA family ATPase [Candidatus Sungbacteria bacterium]